ncbi:MAG: hypothetical protein EA381_06395 [Planctomycetaceae bacterium]|nr:MAG: hypothetical protein EA381_06395 [Planctomycetaceae bacterium]
MRQREATFLRRGSSLKQQDKALQQVKNEWQHRGRSRWEASEGSEPGKHLSKDGKMGCLRHW